MRKNLTEIVFILDRSGSMSGLEADTIGGFNSMIEKQKKENGEALISTVLFDNVSEVMLPSHRLHRRNLPSHGKWVLPASALRALRYLSLRTALSLPAVP